MRRGGGGGGYGGGGGGRYGPPGGYDGDMGGPDGPYMNDFGGRGPPRGAMMRGGNRGGFGPTPHRGPARTNYMDDPFEEEMEGSSTRPPTTNYNENYRDRSRSDEKKHETAGGIN